MESIGQTDIQRLTPKIEYYLLCLFENLDQMLSQLHPITQFGLEYQLVMRRGLWDP